MVRQFKDNNTTRLREDPQYNKCHKVQPLVDCFLSVFKNMVSPETFMSVDEQVNPFNVKYSMKCYLPKNPKKWGCELSPRTGILATFTIFKLVVVWDQKNHCQDLHLWKHVVIVVLLFYDSQILWDQRSINSFPISIFHPWNYSQT